MEYVLLGIGLAVVAGLCLKLSSFFNKHGH